MKVYYIISYNGFGKYVLHTDNNLYLGYICTNIMPCRYTYKSNAIKRLEKVKNRFPQYKLEIEEIVINKAEDSFEGQ